MLYIIVNSYFFNMSKLHNNSPQNYYAVSVIQILTFICNTDIIFYVNHICDNSVTCFYFGNNNKEDLIWKRSNIS